MHHLADIITGLPLDFIGQWGYLILFAVTFLESLPFGFIIPGQTILIFCGLLARGDALVFPFVVIAAAVGAMLGDFLNYFLGNKFALSFLEKYGKYIFFKRSYYDKTKELLNNHTGKTLVFGRFNPITRSFAPFIAGASNIKIGKYTYYNVAGGASWAIIISTLGYLFGSSYELIATYLGRFFFIAIIFSALFIIAYQYINRKRHIFSRYHLYELFANLLCLYLFAKMAEDVVTGEKMVQIDGFINSYIHHLWSPLGNKIMAAFTLIGDPFILPVLALALFLLLAHKRKYYHSSLLFFSLMTTYMSQSILKAAFARPRPIGGQIFESSFSFPSAHAALSVVFFAMLFFSFRKEISSVITRHLFFIFCTIMILGVGFSRIYLKVHWLSDVIAGYALGLFWLTFLALTFKYLALFLKKILKFFGIKITN